MYIPQSVNPKDNQLV